MNTKKPLFIDKEVLVLTKEGIWLADGEEISHVRTRKLFARSLYKSDKGYLIKVSREQKKIQVEDTAYFVQHITQISDTFIEVFLQDIGPQKVSPSTLCYEEGRLTCEILSPTKQKDHARFLSQAYHSLLFQAEESETEFYLKFGDQKITLQKKKR